MLDLAARLGSRGPVSIIDGGDRFQAHVVSRAVRHHLPPGSSGLDLPAALERIMLARAFTCYQMVTLLDDYLAHPVLQSKGRWFPRGRMVADTGDVDPRLHQFPRREPCALQQGPRFIHIDMQFPARLVSHVDRGERRTETRRGEPPRVAVCQYASRFGQQ